MRNPRNLAVYIVIGVACFAVAFLLSSCQDDDEPRATVDVVASATDPTDPPETDPDPTEAAGETARSIAISAFDSMITDAEDLSVYLTNMDFDASERLAGQLADDFDELASDLEGASDADTQEGKEFIAAAEVCHEAFSDLEEGVAEVSVSKIETAAGQIESCTGRITRLS